MHNVIEDFKSYFSKMELADDTKLDKIYTEDIGFEDPIHKINGLANLKKYFKKLNSNLIEGSFHFTKEHVTDQTAYLHWEMTVSLKKPRKVVKATGISVLHFNEKIFHQRDYFDAGEVFYENIPFLGSMIRILKRKLASE